MAEISYSSSSFYSSTGDAFTRRRLTARSERLASPIAAPSTRRVAMLLTAGPSSWTAERSRYLERVFALAPNLATVQELARRFGAMIRQRQADALSVWLDDADTNDLRSFADGLRSDFAAVHAALPTPWSNGQTEGQITPLKLVKRSICTVAPTPTFCASSSWQPEHRHQI